MANEKTYPTMTALAERLGITRQAVAYRMKLMVGTPGHPPLLPHWATAPVRHWKERDVQAWEVRWGHAYVKTWGYARRTRTRRQSK